jgi:hypothetical protein
MQPPDRDSETLKRDGEWPRCIRTHHCLTVMAEMGSEISDPVNHARLYGPSRVREEVAYR